MRNGTIKDDQKQVSEFEKATAGRKSLSVTITLF